MKWIQPSVIALLIALLAAMQTEINDLKAQQAKIGSLDAKAAAAVKQFETDFFAKLRADEKARLAQQAMQDAERNRALQQGLNWLPTGDMNKPVLWGEEPKKNPNQ
jgi:hypothetical protein